MEWRLFANLAEAAGTKRAAVDAEAGDTLGTAFEQLLDAHPELEAIVLDESGELHEHIKVMQNDVDPFEDESGFETELEPDDQLALFPPVSGG